MKRRQPGREKNQHFDAAKPHANPCRALVLVDGTAIRKKIKRDYEKALRDLENSRRQLGQYEQTDLPEFTRWFHGRFGPLLAEIRDLTEKIDFDEAIIIEVQTQTFLCGDSPVRAYKDVMEVLERATAPPAGGPGPGGEDGPKSSPFGEGGEDDDFNGDGPGNPFGDDGFDPFGPDAEAETGRGPWSRSQSQSRPAAPATARLKELYRQLVRRLHPDAHVEMTAQKVEWWHQTQTAYQAGDVDRLEVILTLCEIGDQGTTAHTTASLLQRITEQLKHSLREINRQLKEHRVTPAWNFSRQNNRDLLLAKLRGELTRELEMLREHWRKTQEIIAEWKAKAERPKQPRKAKRKHQPNNLEFPF